jgi:hypothetical protein
MVAPPERRSIHRNFIHEEIVPVGGAVALGPIIRSASPVVGSGGLYGQFQRGIQAYHGLTLVVDGLG